MGRKVVITGIGVLSPIAIGRAAYWDALQAGVTGFRPVTLFDVSHFQVRTAGEITDFDPLPLLGKKGLRDLDRSTRLVSAAARLAIDDSGLVISEESCRSLGVSIGTTFGSLHSIAQFDRSGLIEGPRFVNPSHFPNTVINSPASQVSIRFGIKGFNTTISTGFCASLDALSYAADFIRLGRAECVLAGGVEELCEETFHAFHALGYLSGSTGAQAACRPFDARHDGFVLAEGTAVIVLEEESHALRRGADILATVLGAGNAFDPTADGTFRHGGRGLREAIARALSDAGIGPEAIGYVCASANGVPGLDQMETRALKEALNGHALRIPVSSIKSMVGETFSASGSLAVSAAVGAIRNGFVPSTVDCLAPDPASGLDVVCGGARRMQVDTVLGTAADPYGQNSALLIGRYDR
jgi:3-oxoacyl-[acyl-carrier-protein] synthase II